MLPPPAFLLLSRLSGLPATGPTLSFLHVFLFPPKSPPFPSWRQVLCGFLRFSVSLPPSPIMISFPFPSSRPYSHFHYCSRFRPHSRPRFHPVFVQGSPPMSRSTPPPLPAPVPVPILRSVVHLYPLSPSHSLSISVPVPDSDPAPDPIQSFLSFGPSYPPGAMRVYRQQAVRTELCVCVYLLNCT